MKEFLRCTKRAVRYQKMLEVIGIRILGIREALHQFHEGPPLDVWSTMLCFAFKTYHRIRVWLSKRVQAAQGDSTLEHHRGAHDAISVDIPQERLTPCPG